MKRRWRGNWLRARELMPIAVTFKTVKINLFLLKLTGMFLISGKRGMQKIQKNLLVIIKALTERLRGVTPLRVSL